MNRFLILLTLATVGPIAAFGQENSFMIQGGYSFSTGDVAGTTPSGFKINVHYDFAPTGNHWTLGGSFGYIRLSGTTTAPLAGATYSLSSMPICFVPKFTFGSESFKGYIKGAIGAHASFLSWSGTLAAADDSQWGMSIGLGAGASYYLSDKIFINAEYEWLRLSNAIEDSGTINSAVLGIGMKF